MLWLITIIVVLAVLAIYIAESDKRFQRERNLKKIQKRLEEIERNTKASKGWEDTKSGEK